MNTKRSQAFLKIKQNIFASKNMEHLQVCRDMIKVSYNKLTTEEVIVLSEYYDVKRESFQDKIYSDKNEKIYQDRKEKEFDYECDSMESLYHQKKCGGHSTY